MRKTYIILLTIISPILFAAGIAGNEEEAISILPSVQRPGDSAKGYEYLITGDYIRSGVPYGYFIMANGKSKENILNRSGKNANVSPRFNVVTKNGVDMVVPTCLQCHAQYFDSSFIIGLGNTFLDFTNTASRDFSKQIKAVKTLTPRQYKEAHAFFTSFTTIFPLIQTETRGVNNADRLATTLIAHRDPQTLKWNDTALLGLKPEVIPTDVPAWWLMKKKNAMFYTGFARGDFAKFLMFANLLAVSDSSEAREVSNHFNDVLAYIRSIQPPKYPHAIDMAKAETGRHIFNNTCSGCHGKYGKEEEYPNLLIPISIIQTDSLLAKGVMEDKQFNDWFRRSWFVQGDNPAYLVPFNGYIAPPLDGVWITAPYMHNASVPTLEAMLNSKIRPAYWSRSFEQPEYDYTSVGWKYSKHNEAGNKAIYNTTLPGYGNRGHYFGDALTDEERMAVIEYLKTL